MSNTQQFKALMRLNLGEFAGYFIIMAGFLLIRLVLLHFFSRTTDVTWVFLIFNLIAITSWALNRDAQAILSLPLGKNPRRTYIQSLYAMLLICTVYVCLFLAIGSTLSFVLTFFTLSIMFGSIVLAVSIMAGTHRNVAMAISFGVLAAFIAGSSIYASETVLPQLSPLFLLLGLLLGLIFMELGIRVFQRKDV